MTLEGNVDHRQMVPAPPHVGHTLNVSMPRDRVVAATGRTPTVRDFIQVTGRGTLKNPVVGGPKEIADRLEEFWSAPACDGFVIGSTHNPGCFEDFVKFVVPELQRRSLFRKDYTGTILRDHLGLPRPPVGHWQRSIAAAD